MAFPIVFRSGRALSPNDVNPFWSSVERLALDLQRDAAVQAPVFAPRLEVVERENEYVVTAELAGVEEKDFQIEVHGSVFTLRGEKRNENAEETARPVDERVYGAFRRAIELPVEVASDKASATFKNGVLSVTLPKAETAKVRHIPVNVA